VNFIVVRLHCLDVGDFHSHLELTGIWTAPDCDSASAEDGYYAARNCWLPKTVIEIMRDSGYQVVTRIPCQLGSRA
jgi:hypothetical protein